MHLFVTVQVKYNVCNVYLGSTLYMCEWYLVTITCTAPFASKSFRVWVSLVTTLLESAGSMLWDHLASLVPSHQLQYK